MSELKELLKRFAPPALRHAAKVVLRRERPTRARASAPDRDKEPVYIFVHVPKTGGTTFHSSYLPAAFTEDQRFVVNGTRDHNARDIERVIRLPEPAKRRLRIIAGHNTFGLARYFDRAEYMTVLRSPVSLTLSAYMHARYHVPESEGAQYMRQRCRTLEDFVQNPPPAHLFGFGVTNHDNQVRSLSGCDLGRDEILPERALQSILDKIAFVGITERLDLFLFSLHIRAGFPLVLYNNRLVRKEKAGFRVSEQQRRLIEAFNPNDVKLYELARERFERETREMWSTVIEAKWIAFRALLRHFRHTTRQDVNRARKVQVDVVLS
jgi:hypothetical protein